MSLTTRLQALFAILTIAFLAAGLALVIHHARTAVHAELASSVNLTAALISGAVAAGQETPEELIDRLDAVTLQRHIRLEKRRDDRHRPLSTEPRSEAGAPAWFTGLVGFDPDMQSREVRLNDPADTVLVIRAEPADEIAEAWQGARGLLALLIGFGAIAALLTQWLLRRALSPLRHLLRGLGALEQGDYTSRLRIAGAPELRRVSLGFNQLSAALQEAQTRNRRLSRELLEIQEDERRHLARELHDEMGQCTSALQAEAVAIRDDRTPLPARTREGAEAIRDTARHLHHLARRLIRRLHPAELDALGLESALHTMCDDWQGRHPDVRLHTDFAATARMPAGSAHDIHVYRVVQEALSNISRHARASQACVRLRMPGQALQLTVADNGAGFPPSPPGPGSSGGFGLTGMAERVRSLGGRLRIISRSGAGSCLACRFPLPDGAPSGPGHVAPLVQPQKRAVSPAITVRPAPGRSPS
ncbi:ATP-binding protein [Aquisalimonas asiatica]|uniref:Oxygen sensor histidine kinase NreB n=1 Tax=Aquisalimonas asiatica TaxID=406100 RepID=A0A1H8V8L4_9GAMM|nr:ATP-binding protein [Aquisalimonas asiatica]SEP11661.1 signal transduction histidine kinase, glucose-6-phosphate specific [Aquisalimonas asiatica]